MDADYEDIGENGDNEYGDADLGLVADAKYLEMLMMQIWVWFDILTLYVRPWLGPCMVAPSNHHAHHVIYAKDYTETNNYTSTSASTVANMPITLKTNES